MAGNETMTTYVCLYRNKIRGGIYAKAFSASNRKVAEKRGIEWAESESRRNVAKPTKGVRAVVERAFGAIIQESKKGNPVLVFGTPV